MIALNDLKRASSDEGGRVTEAAQRVLSSGWYVLGPEVVAFERRFADYCGVEQAVGVGNGTDALELAFRALGLRPGDGIAMVANAGMYAATAARAAGCEPVFCDIRDDSMLLDPHALSALDAGSVKAVVVTHLYGLLADVPAILEVARRRGWYVIEDCAQAHGAAREGRRAGGWGDLAAFSFYPTKNLGASGDGGAVLGSDPDLMAAVRALRQYGWSDKYHVGRSGGRNSRLDELQAAILTERLGDLDRNNARRRAIADRYASALTRSSIRMQPADGEAHVRHLCVLRTDRRDALRAHLHGRGVATDIHYPCPDHRQTVWSGLYDQVHLPVTERACRQLVTVPCHPWLREDEIEQVADALATFQ